MLLLDLHCTNCHKDYNVVDFGTSYLIHPLNENNHHETGEEIDTDELKCPYCGSISYEERYIDNNWEED